MHFDILYIRDGLVPYRFNPVIQEQVSEVIMDTHSAQPPQCVTWDAFLLTHLFELLQTSRQLKPALSPLISLISKSFQPADPQHI